MTYDSLFVSGIPAIYLLAVDTSEADNLYLQLSAQNKKAVIRRVRGKKSKTVDDFFNEVSAALQFPLYFGENWNAFNDCINDLEWLGGEGYVLLVNDAPFLLCEADGEDFHILVKMLSLATEQWLEPNKYWPRNRPPTPFHTVLQCSAADIEVLHQRLKQLGITYQML